MAYTLVPFSENHLDTAAALFQQTYQREQQANRLLPGRAQSDPAWILGSLREHLSNPGVAVMDGDRLLAYMLTGPQFSWKGQRCALVPEIAHSSIEACKPVLYQRMYMHMAEQWVANGIHLHLIGHLAHDAVLKETLFQLGYGAILAERLRDLTSIKVETSMDVVQVTDAHDLVTLEVEHASFYPKPPIFLRKETDAEQTRKDLEDNLAAGDALFAVYDDGIARAYSFVGESCADAEGLLLRETNSAQVKSMYSQSAYRGKGIGAALLQATISWARDHGYERLMVEHETANIFGGNFWRKHFEPYVYYSMRYVDNTLGGKS